MSMFTVVPIGLGLGPIVMLEVLVVPDSTALMVVLEAPETFAGNMLKKLKADNRDNKIRAHTIVEIGFLIFILVGFLPIWSRHEQLASRV